MFERWTRGFFNIPDLIYHILIAKNSIPAAAR